jgi:hypothetical protein
MACQRAKEVPLDGDASRGAKPRPTAAQGDYDMMDAPSSNDVSGDKLTSSSKPASPNSAAARGGESDDDDGFVHVTAPMLTVRQFTDWLQKTRLPNASQVMQGNVDEEDTIQILVNRCSYIDDVLQAFRGKLSSLGNIDEDAWPRLFEQFVRDLPREEVHLGGEPLMFVSQSNPHHHQGDSLDDSSGAPRVPASSMDSRTIEDTVLPAIRRFICKRIPTHLLDPQLWKDRADAIRASELAKERASLMSWLNPVGAIAYLAGAAVGTLMGPTGSSSSSSNDKPSSSSSPASRAGSTPSSSALPTATDPQAASPASTRAAAAGAGCPTSPEEIVECYTRLVVLVCQQSVLAFPFEIINAQFCQELDRPLFVGEMSKNDPRHAGAKMRVNIIPTPGRDTGALLHVHKMFRVFSLSDSNDYTLFYIEMRVEFDLFAQDDDVVLTWKILPAASPVQRQQLYGLNGSTERACQCLGAGAGYHKKNCAQH